MTGRVTSRVSGRVPSPSVPAAPRLAVPVTGSLEVRVRYCECDPMGVAHHAAYAPWLEIARTEMLREAGITYAHMERDGVFLVVAQLQIRYRRPVYYDDLLEIRTRVSGGGRVKINHEYEILLAESGARAAQHRSRADILTQATTVLVCVDSGGSVRALPDWLAPAT